MFPRMKCPICTPVIPEESIARGDFSAVDVFECPSHGTFGVLRSRRMVFDRLDAQAKVDAIDTARMRNMVEGYPVIDAFSL